MKIEEQVNGSVPKKDVLLLLPGIKNYDKLLDDYRWAVQNVPNYRPLHEILELLLFEESYCEDLMLIELVFITGNTHSMCIAMVLPSIWDYVNAK